MASGKRNVYRKAALERLSSPEQLDKMITIVPAGLWIAAIGGAVIVALTLIWSLVGRIPVTVQTNGIYMYGNGVHTIYAGNGGIVDAVYVDDGNVVLKDEVMAVYENDEVQRKIDDLNERRGFVEAVTIDSIGDIGTDDNKGMLDIKSQLLTVDSNYLADAAMLDTKQRELDDQTVRTDEAYDSMISARERYYDLLNEGSTLEEQLAWQDAQNDVQEARSDWQQAKSDWEYAKGDVDRAKSDVATAKSDYDRAKSDASTAKSDYDRAMNNVDRAKSDLDRAKSDVSTAKNDVDRAKSDLDRVKNDVTSAKSEVDRAKSDVDRAKSDLDRAKSDVATAKSDVDRAQSNLDRIKNDISASKADVDRAKSDLATAKSEYDRLVSAYNTAQSEYNTAYSYYNQAKSNYDNAKLQYDSYTGTDASGGSYAGGGNYQAQIDDINAKLDIIGILYSDQYTKEKTKYTSEVTNGQLYQIMMQLREYVTVIEGSSDQPTTNNDPQDVDTWLNRIMTSDFMKAYNDSTSKTQNAEFSRKSNAYQLFMTYYQTFKSLLSNREDLESQLKQLKNQEAQYKDSKDLAEQKLKEEKEKLETASENAADKKKAVDDYDYDARIEEINESIEIAKKVVSENEARLAEAEEKVKEAQEKADDTDAVTAAEEEVKKREEELKKSQESVQGFEEELEEAEKKIKEAETGVSDAESGVDDAKKKVSDAEKEAEEAKKKAEEAEEEADKEKLDISDLEEAVDDAKDHAESLRKEISTAREAIDTARTKYYDAEREYIAAEKAQLERHAEAGKAGDQYNVALNDYNTELNAKRSLDMEVDQLETQTMSDMINADRQRDMIEMQFDNAKAAALSQIDKDLKTQQEAMRNSEIRATVDGLVTGLRIAEGNAIQAGSAVANVTGAPEMGMPMADNFVVSYVPVSEARKLERGMQVKIYPTTANRNEYGHMEGNIVNVDSYVTSREDMLNQLGDATLVDSFLKSGPVVEVTTELRIDETTASGYYWSNEKGRRLDIEEGTLVTTDMVTESKAPISMLIPYLKDKFDRISTRESTQNGSAQNDIGQNGQ